MFSVLFPGQGSQSVGMIKDLYDNFRYIKDLFIQADDELNLPLSKIIECLTINPSNILKINKGTLKKGSDADICVIDLNKPWVVKAGNLKSKSKNTAIEDKKLQGKVLMTFLKGEPVFKI